MPKTLSQRAQKVLVLIKQTYNRAYDDSMSKYRYVSRIQALIGFDWANEAALKAAIRKFKPKADLNGDLNTLTQQCVNLMESNNCGSISPKKNISYVRRVRNQAQHEARYPTVVELQDCRTYTRDFLSAFVSQIWGVEWDQISMAEAVEHLGVKEYLEKSEACLKEGEHQNAVSYATVGFKWALKAGEYALFRCSATPPSIELGYECGDHLSYKIGELGSKVEMRLGELSKWINDKSDEQTEISTVVSFGLDLEMYMRFRSLAPRVQFAISGNPWIDLRKSTYTGLQTGFVLQFCIDSILQLESIVGDLSAPFGHKSKRELKVVDL